ncbi:TIR domain-containing protein [Marmoricola sp. URHB0036]|uniref:TIR domain-containing protein n=1 Tax=Marmoricola sp. URHB0036 TaxID=1298863 RepID=UPI00068575D5|nr:TIR domain-containing protein [Marmoricola sp. URHB0036]
MAKSKLFISWSGEYAKGVAQALRAWIPNLFDDVEPFMSDNDIAAGQRGMNVIESRLDGTQFGIIVVTDENQSAPWLNFEAGALSKTITENVEQRVAPLLVDVSSPAQLTGPLTQFQAKVMNKDGIRGLMRSLGEMLGIEPDRVDKRVEAHWAELEAALERARPSGGVNLTKPPRPPEEMLDEILEHVRAMRNENDAVRAAAIRSRRLGDDRAIRDVVRPIAWLEDATQMIFEAGKRLDVGVNRVLVEYRDDGREILVIEVPAGTPHQVTSRLAETIMVKVPGIMVDIRVFGGASRAD